MKKREHFSRDSAKRLSNPAYTNVRVHRSLIDAEGRKYDTTLFIYMAHKKAQTVGSEHCLRDFLKALRLKDDEWISLIPIHASFAEERPALMSEEEFIATGVKLMLEIGVAKYFGSVIENMGQGIILMATETRP